MGPKEKGQEQKEIDFSKVEYLISDWDGTLADSMPAYTKCFADTLEETFGINSQDSKKYYLSSVGESLSNQLKTAAKRFAGVEIQDSTSLENTFWRNLTGLKPDIIPGAKEFLAKLKKRGVKIIVWSGTRTDVLEEKANLLSLSSFIDFYIGNEPGSTTMVKGPGLFSIIARHFKLDEDKLRSLSLVIGDGNGDMEAGKKVGAKTVGIVRIQTKDALREAGADVVVENLEELEKLFE